MPPIQGSIAGTVPLLQIDGVIVGSVGWSFYRQWLSAYQQAALRALAQAGGVALYRAGVFDSERATRIRVELSNYDVVRRGRIVSDVNSSLDLAAETTHVARRLED